MSIEVVVPRLGWSMDEGTFAGWLKQDGEWVEAGDMLFVLESDKAAQEIESFDAGILRIPPNAPAVGDTVTVGQVLAFLVPQGEPAPFESGATRETEKPAPAAALPPSANEQSAPATPAVTTAAANKVSPRAPSDAPATPRARRAARRLGVDCTSLRGSGRNGRIRERDVLAAGPAGMMARSGQTAGRIEPITRLRRAIAERMSAGVHQAAPVTLTTQADAGRLVQMRREWKAAQPEMIVPTYTDLFIKLVATTLQQHPQLTGQWRDDGIFYPAGIDIAFAVDTDAGLLAPVVRDVPSKSLAEIAEQSLLLAERARRGQLSADELQGGVFTVTNLGHYGIDAFTPIINLPQAAILGIGRIAPQPVVVNDQLQPRDVVTLSLTFDHRVIDGGPAARFLQALCRAMSELNGA